MRLKRGRETDDANLVHDDVKASEETSVSLLRTGRQLLVWGGSLFRWKKSSCELQLPWY